MGEARGWQTLVWGSGSEPTGFSGSRGVCPGMRHLGFRGVFPGRLERDKDAPSGWVHRACVCPIGAPAYVANQDSGTRLRTRGGDSRHGHHMSVSFLMRYLPKLPPADATLGQFAARLIAPSRRIAHAACCFSSSAPETTPLPFDSRRSRT